MAAAAQRRFGRSITIGQLGYLAGGAPHPTPTSVPPAAIELPGDWRHPLAEIASRDPQDALAWYWHDCNHERFGSHDGEFAGQVRRSLCVPGPASDEGLVACP